MKPSFPALCGLLIPAALLAQSVTGDRVLVGSTTATNYSNIQKLPLPTFANQKFCDLIQLAPNVLTWAYVPTARERSGDFGAFPTPLPDPQTSGTGSSSFPGNVIPASRIPSTFAWRLPVSGPAAGEVCVPYLQLLSGGAGVPFVGFTTANYVSGLNPQTDVVRALPTAVGFDYRLGDPVPATQNFTIAAGGAPLRYLVTVLSSSIANGQPATGTPSWLAYNSGPCCKATGSTEQVGILPRNLVPGPYIAQLSIVAIGAISTPQTVTINLLVRAPPDWLVVSTRTVDLGTYSMGSSVAPSPKTFTIVSLGSGASFTTSVKYVTPASVGWFTYSPSAGNSVATITVTPNINILRGSLGRGSFVGYIDVFAGTARANTATARLRPNVGEAPVPNSPQRVVVTMSVSPNPDFTVFPDSLLFSFDPNNPFPDGQRVNIKPVNAPVHATGALGFNVAVTNQDAGDADWVVVAPGQTGIPNDLQATLIAAGVQSLTPGATHQALISFNAPGQSAAQDVNTGGMVAVAVQIPPRTVDPITLPPLPSISTGGIVPLFSTSGTIQPGSWVSIFGSNLAAGNATWDGDFPTSLGNTSVTINGKSAFFWFVSPGQLNIQTPDDSARGNVPVTVTTPGGSTTGTVSLGSFGPSFSLLDAGRHVAGVILRSNGSGTQGGGTYDIVGPTGTSLGFRTVAAKAGDNLALFGVGFGPTNPAVSAGRAFTGAAPTTNPVQLFINNVSVTPAFAGMIGAGLYQMNLTVPSGLGTGDVSLRAVVSGVQTPSGVVLSLQ